MRLSVHSGDIRRACRNLLKIGRYPAYISLRERDPQKIYKGVGRDLCITEHLTQAVKRVAYNLPESAKVVSFALGNESGIGFAFFEKKLLYVQRGKEIYKCCGVFANSGRALYFFIEHHERCDYPVSRRVYTQKLFVAALTSYRTVTVRIHVPHDTVCKSLAVYLPLFRIKLKFIGKCAFNTA